MVPKNFLCLSAAALLLIGLGCSKKAEEQKPPEESTTFDAIKEEPVGQTPEELASKENAPPTRNEPIFFNTPEENDFVISMGKFSSRQEAEALSRELRRERVNNYVYARDTGRYYVLVGPFVSRKQATRQQSILFKRGFDRAEVFAARELN